MFNVKENLQNLSLTPYASDGQIASHKGNVMYARDANANNAQCPKYLPYHRHLPSYLCVWKVYQEKQLVNIKNRIKNIFILSISNVIPFPIQCLVPPILIFHTRLNTFPHV